MTESPGIRWGAFELDPGTRVFRRNEQVVPVQPRVFDVLSVLSSNLDQAVSRQEILERCWSGTRVVDNALTQVIRKARVALADDVDAPKWLLSVARYGYRLRGVPAAARSRWAASDSFVGRGDERARLAVPGAGLRVVVGPGGGGKTRLAREALVDRGESVWVDVGGARDAETVAGLVAGALGVAPTSLGDALARLEGPLVLDDLAPTAGGELGRWTSEAPSLELWVTCRVAPEAPAAEHLRLAPLPLSDALTLLEHRAGRVLRAEPGIEALAELLDGSPLAIELLGSRASAMRAADLVTRLAGRLTTTRDHRRDRPRHHDTLGACLGASLELLPLTAREALVSLSAFEEQFDRAASEEVAGGAADGLPALVEHGLVRAVGDRYRFPDPIREWARTLPGADHPDLLARHAGWVVAEGVRVPVRDALAAAYRPLPDGPLRVGLSRLLARLRGRHPVWSAMADALTALADAATEPGERSAILVDEYGIRSALGRSNRPRLDAIHAEMAPLVDAVDPELRARAWIVRTAQCSIRGDLEGAIAGAVVGLGLTTDPEQQYLLSATLGWNQRRLGKTIEAHATAVRTLELARTLDAEREAGALTELGRLEVHLGNLAEADRLVQQAVRVFQSHGLRGRLLDPLNLLGLIAYELGDAALAAARWGDALALAREFAEPSYISIQLQNLGSTAFETGDLDTADAMFREARQAALAGGRTAKAGFNLARCAMVARKRGQLDDARQMAEQALAEAGTELQVKTIAGIELALIEVAAGDLDRAAALLDQADPGVDGPESLRFQMAIGRAYLLSARGSRDAALEQLDLAKRVMPQEARGPRATHLANLRKELG